MEDVEVVNQELNEKPKKGGSKVIGIIVLILAVVLLFTMCGGNDIVVETGTNEHIELEFNMKLEDFIEKYNALIENEYLTNSLSIDEFVVEKYDGMIEYSQQFQLREGEYAICIITDEETGNIIEVQNVFPNYFFDCATSEKQWAIYMELVAMYAVVADTDMDTALEFVKNIDENGRSYDNEKKIMYFVSEENDCTKNNILPISESDYKALKR